MVAAAAKQKIKIEYTTIYKNLKTQEEDFKKINSLKTTNVSKSSTVPEVKNGRLYKGVKWYPTTITGYNPLPGFNIFGTGLCIKIKNNNDKIINFIKVNGADYGWSWCSNFPTSDPDFQNILVYFAGKNKPNKYRDRTSEYPELGFQPNRDKEEILGYNPKTHKSVFVPNGKGSGQWETVEIPKKTNKTSVTQQIYVDAKNNESPLKGVTFAPSGLLGSQPNNKSIKVLVLNNTTTTNLAGNLSNVLKNLGFTTSRAVSCLVQNFNDYGGPSNEWRGVWGSKNITGSLLRNDKSSYRIPGGVGTNPVVIRRLTDPFIKIIKFIEDNWLNIPEEPVLNFLTEAKVVDAINHRDFLDFFQLSNFCNYTELQKTLHGISDIILDVELPTITTVFIKKDVSVNAAIGDNFVDILKYIEQRSHQNELNVVEKSPIQIKKIEITNSNFPKIYDYMTNGNNVVLDISLAKYCLLHGYYKLINNNRLTKEIYGTVEIDPTNANIQYQRYGSSVKDHQFINKLFNFLEFTDIKPWPNNYPTLDGSPKSNWALAERAPIAGDHFDSSLVSSKKKEYRSLSKVFVPVKLKYQVIEPADIIVSLDSNWGGITPSINSILPKLKLDEKVVKTIQYSNTSAVKSSNSIRLSLPPKPTTSSTVPLTTTTLPKTTTTSTTVPRSTTTNPPLKSNTKKPPAKFIPPADRIDNIANTTSTAVPKTTTILNKVPVIIGDSIALGIALRYDNQNDLANTQRLTQPSLIENIPDIDKKAITIGRKMEWI